MEFPDRGAFGRFQQIQAYVLGRNGWELHEETFADCRAAVKALPDAVFVYLQLKPADPVVWFAEPGRIKRHGFAKVNRQPRRVCAPIATPARCEVVVKRFVGAEERAVLINVRSHRLGALSQGARADPARRDGAGWSIQFELDDRIQQIALFVRNADLDALVSLFDGSRAAS